MKNDFKFCPICSSTKILNHNNRKWACEACGFDLYNNVASAVGAVIFDDEKNVLFEIREKNPQKGKLALPGGFVDFDESAENAILRECKEELGIEIQNPQFICTFPNTYVYKNIEYKTCDMFFAVKLNCSVPEYIKNMQFQESEVSELKYFKISSKDDVKNLDIAFESTRKTLIKWVDLWKQDK